MTAHGYSHVAALVAPVLSSMLQPLKSGVVLKGKNAWGDPGLWYASQDQNRRPGVGLYLGSAALPNLGKSYARRLVINSIQLSHQTRNWL